MCARGGAFIILSHQAALQRDKKEGGTCGYPIVGSASEPYRP